MSCSSFIGLSANILEYPDIFSPRMISMSIIKKNPSLKSCISFAFSPIFSKFDHSRSACISVIPFNDFSYSFISFS
eukprot:24222_6